MNGGSARGKCNVTIGLIARSGPLAIGLGKKKKKKKRKEIDFAVRNSVSRVGNCNLLVQTLVKYVRRSCSN